MALLQDYDWPGNVRELKNVLERAIITANTNVVHLSDGLGGPVEGPKEPVQEKNETDWPTMDTLQQRYILKVLDKVDGRIEGAGGAAAILGMKPSTLRHRISKLSIKR